MKRHAVALRAFTHADDSFAEDDKLFLDAGQFADWSAEGVDLVRAASEAEIGKDTPKPASKPKVKKPAKPAKPKSAAPVSAPAVGAAEQPAQVPIDTEAAATA